MTATRKTPGPRGNEEPGRTSKPAVEADPNAHRHDKAGKVRRPAGRPRGSRNKPKPPATPVPVEYLSPKRVEAMFDKGPGAAKRWRMRGDGPPYVRFGPRTVRYRMADVRAWAERHGPVFESTSDEAARAAVAKASAERQRGPG
jgi:hypothetical protein